jgi:hypothetical protein
MLIYNTLHMYVVFTASKNAYDDYYSRIPSRNSIWNLSKIDLYTYDNPINNMRFFKLVIVNNKLWHPSLEPCYSVVDMHRTPYFMIVHHINHIIDGDTYDIFDIKTVKKFYKYINITESHVDLLCYLGKIETLDFLFKKFGLELKYSVNALNNASSEGHVNVLTWWFKSNLPLEYNARALNNASLNGHVNVLEWWLKSGLELKYTGDSLKLASEKGHVHVLEWWKKSGLELQYDEKIFDNCINIDSLNWWKNSGLELKYSEYTLETISSMYDCLKALEWWKNSGLKLKYSNSVLEWTSKDRHSSKWCYSHVLKWWKNSGLGLSS